MCTAMIEDRPGREILERARQGDRRAFERLVDTFCPRLEALVRLKLGPELRAKVEADDIVQETFSRALGSVGTLRSLDEGQFFRWLP